MSLVEAPQERKEFGLKKSGDHLKQVMSEDLGVEVQIYEPTGQELTPVENTERHPAAPQA